MLQMLPLNAFRSQTLLNLAVLLGWQMVGDAVLMMCKARPSMPSKATSGIEQDLARLNGLLLLVGEAPVCSSPLRTGHVLCLDAFIASTSHPWL